MKLHFNSMSTAKVRMMLVDFEAMVEMTRGDEVCTVIIGGQSAQHKEVAGRLQADARIEYQPTDTMVDVEITTYHGIVWKGKTAVQEVPELSLKVW